MDRPPPPVLLIRRHRPVRDTPGADAALAAGRRAFDGPIGPSRLGELLERLVPGLEASTTAVRHWLPDLDAGPKPLTATDLGGRFGTVVLGSHLVNAPDDGLRAALLATAARHLASDGALLVEHHPLDWTSTAAESWTERHGTRLGMVEVRVQPPFVSAVSVYQAPGRTIRQPFTARVLSEPELDAALAAVGLRRARRLAATWLEARRAGAVS